MSSINKRGFYSPWGYIEENDYQSGENLFEDELDKLMATAQYNSEDGKIHFFNKDGDELSGTSIDTTEFAGGGVIESADYDTTTKILTIRFSNGDVTEIDFAELVDETEFGDGLIVADGKVSVKADATSESYLSVGEDGVKISGIDSAIQVEANRASSAEAILEANINAEIDRAIAAEAAEKQRAEGAENTLNSKIDAEVSRAVSAETDLQAAIDAEETRATAAEGSLNTKIDTEISRASAAENTLTQSISSLSSSLEAEKSIREAADLSLGVRVDNEKTRAEGAEAALQTAIDAEETRATAVEQALDERINEIAGSYSGAIDSLEEKLSYKNNDTLVRNNTNEVAFGKYNVSNTGDTPHERTVFSVGNGTDEGHRSNAFEVREDGTMFLMVEGDFMNINDLLSMLAHEVYSDAPNP